MQNYRHGKFLLAAFLCLGYCGCGNNGNPAPSLPPFPVAPKPTPSQKAGIWIEQSKSIPVAVGSRIPHGGQSEFCGEAKIPSQKLDLLLHFYLLRAKSSRYCLDVFSADDKKLNHPRLLHSIRFKYTAFPDVPELQIFEGADAQILWLDPASKNKPVVKLDCRSIRYKGPYGNIFLIIFPRGFNHKAVVQQFDYSCDNSTGDTFEFDKVDERGLMMVTDFTTFSGGNNQARVTNAKWNGQLFKWDGKAITQNY